MSHSAEKQSPLWRFGTIGELGAPRTVIEVEGWLYELAQLLADKGIRVNAVAPGPVWTPLIPSTMPAEHVVHFGENYPIKRARPAARASPQSM